MKRLSLKALSIILIGGAVVAWFNDPSRRIDWIPLFVIGMVVGVVDTRISDLEKRLDKPLSS